MLISMAAFDAVDTSKWITDIWVTIKDQHEDALTTLLDAVTSDSQYFYITVGEIVLSGLSEDQIYELRDGREDLIYRDDFDSVYVLEDLWDEVKDAAAKIAPNATRQRLIAVNLSLADPQMIDKLRTELANH